MISARSDEGLGDNVDSKPSVSFVIVTYNSEEDISLCLNSLEPHLRDGLGEAVIIDNASKDGTFAKVRSHDSASIAFIENDTNVGFTRAVNKGIEQSAGEFVYILNPDTQVTENSIDGLVRRLRSNTEIAAVAPQLRLPDARVQFSCRRFPTLVNVLSEMLRFNSRSDSKGWKMADFDHASERDVDQPAGAALMVRKSILSELGGLDERFPMFFSDVDLCKRIKDAGWRIVFCPEATVTHKGGSSVLERRSAMIVTSHISLIKYFFKHNRRVIDFIPNVLMAILLLLGIPIRLLANLLSPQTEPEGRIL